MFATAAEPNRTYTADRKLKTMYDHETRKRIEVALKRAKEAKRNPPKQYRAQAWRKIGDIIVADSKNK